MKFVLHSKVWSLAQSYEKLNLYNKVLKLKYLPALKNDNKLMHNYTSLRNTRFQLHWQVYNSLRHRITPAEYGTYITWMSHARQNYGYFTASPYVICIYPFPSTGLAQQVKEKKNWWQWKIGNNIYVETSLIPGTRQ